MAKRTRKSRSNRSRAALFGIGMVLGALLVVAAWSVRGLLVPEDASVRVDRVLHPGAFEDRMPWARDRMDVAAATLDDLGEVEGRAVELDPDVPLEEGNRRLTRAVEDAGLEVLDVVELDRGASERRAEMTVGLDGREVGRIQLAGHRRAPRPSGPRIALVIDDLGRQPMEFAGRFLELDFPLALTVLPGMRNSVTIVDGARARGMEVLLHLPMEPVGYPRNDPGEGAILVHMSEGRVRDLVRRHLASLPGVVGISNHMGSMATQDRPTMSAIFDVLDDEGMWFLDSRTTAKTIVPRIARERGVPAVQNDLFLDNERDPEAIRERMAQLVKMAGTDGNAVGIFHPHEVCLEVIPGEVARHRAEGVQFVPLAELDRGRWIGGIPG